MMASAELVTWGVTLVLTALPAFERGGDKGMLLTHIPPTPRPCPLSSPRCLIYMTNVNTLPPQDLAPFPVLTV